MGKKPALTHVQELKLSETLPGVRLASAEET